MAGVWTLNCGLVFCLLFAHVTDGRRSFTIDYEHDTFLMDGQPFRYVSGSAHYFRMPRQYWRDRLRKMRAGGLNAVSTYVEWSQHEEKPGQYNFEGDLNLVEFIKKAEEEGLYVILRPGPYICAERDMGGLPYWLLTKHPDVYLRTNDTRYTKYVDRWLTVLMPLIQPLLYGNGGPIIMVQVENEYGSYSACDKDYQVWLRDIFRSYVEDKAVLFTTDGNSRNFLECGKIPGVYATVDFGSGFTDVWQQFAAQRIVEPRGPLVNSEYYSGWLTHWGEIIQTKSPQLIADGLDMILDYGANVNIYMYFGGTNFGFTAGANKNGARDPYVSDITSYDYDAPLDESGNPTEKYYAIRRVISKYYNVSSDEVNIPTKGSFGRLLLKQTANLFHPTMRESLGVTTRSRYPQTFESLNQNFGYLLYETNMVVHERGGVRKLRADKVHDFANIFINNQLVATFSREFSTNRANVNVSQGDILSVIVENLGRINYGKFNNDTKGLLSNVTLDDNLLENWNMTQFQLSDVTPVVNCYNTRDCLDNSSTAGFNFYMIKFYINATTNGTYLADSYLDVSGLTKGLVFLNGYNLGRYWSTRGPQLSLYVPGVYLKSQPSVNVIIVLDENIQEDEVVVEFVKAPIYSKQRRISRMSNSV